MIWSPVIKYTKEGSKVDNFDDLRKIKEHFNSLRIPIDVQIVIGDDYIKVISKLRKIAATATEELKSPIMRFLQIEEKTKKNVSGRNYRNYIDNTDNVFNTLFEDL